MKFLVPNYSCFQNPWLGGRGLPPTDPRSHCPLSSTEFLDPHPEQNSWVRHWRRDSEPTSSRWRDIRRSNSAAGRFGRWTWDRIGQVSALARNDKAQPYYKPVTRDNYPHKQLFNTIGKGKIEHSTKSCVSECTYDPRMSRVWGKPRNTSGYSVSLEKFKSGTFRIHVVSDTAWPNVLGTHVYALKTMCENGYGCSENTPLLFYDMIWYIILLYYIIL